MNSRCDDAVGETSDLAVEAPRLDGRSIGELELRAHHLLCDVRIADVQLLVATPLLAEDRSVLVVILSLQTQHTIQDGGK